MSKDLSPKDKMLAAIRNGELEKIEDLDAELSVTSAADQINYAEDFSYIEEAVLSGSTEAVDFLLDKGAKMVASNNQHTMLHVAVERGDVAMVRHLVARLCDENEQTKIKNPHPAMIPQTTADDLIERLDQSSNRHNVVERGLESVATFAQRFGNKVKTAAVETFTENSVSSTSGRGMTGKLERRENIKAQNEQMAGFLGILKMSSGADRESAVQVMFDQEVVKVPASGRSGGGVSSYNQDRYTNKKITAADGTVTMQDSAALWRQVRENVEQIAKADEEARKAVKVAEIDFLGKVESGKLTKEDIDKCKKDGVNIGCTTSYSGENGYESGLHIAARKGNVEAFKLLVENLVQSGQVMSVNSKNQTAIEIIESKAQDSKNPKKEQHTEMLKYWKDEVVPKNKETFTPRSSPKDPVAEPLEGKTQEKTK